MKMYPLIGRGIWRLRSKIFIVQNHISNTILQNRQGNPPCVVTISQICHIYTQRYTHTHTYVCTYLPLYLPELQGQLQGNWHFSVPISVLNRHFSVPISVQNRHFSVPIWHLSVLNCHFSVLNWHVIDVWVDLWVAYFTGRGVHV